MFDLIFVLVPILAIGVFAFVIGMMFVPSLRSKFMGHQLRMQKRIILD